MKTQLKIRLSFMMFIQFTALGTVIPVLSHHFKNSLGASGKEMGTVFALASLTGFISPFIGSIVADRLVSSARLLSFCNAGAGIFLLILSFTKTFHNSALAYLAYALLAGPVFALVNAITFHNATDAKKQFTPIRIWGTIGFIAIAWFCILIAPAHDSPADRETFLRWSLRVGGILSFIVALYALTLPRRRIHVAKKAPLLPIESIKVFQRRDAAVLILIACIISIIDKFHFFAGAPFLSQSGFADKYIMPAMSIGQIAEIFAIISTAALLKRFGIKKILAAGLFMEALRFTCYAAGTPVALIYIGLAVHGFMYAYFFLGVSIWIDSCCSVHSRTGVHQIVAMLLSGLGGILGNVLCGKAMDYFTAANGIVNYTYVWMIPAITAAIVLCVFIIFFRENSCAPQHS